MTTQILARSELSNSAARRGLVYGQSYHILAVIVPRATIVLREKRIDEAGNIAELVDFRMDVGRAQKR